MSKRTSRWVVALTTLLCCFLWAAPAQAGPNDDGPVFLVLDLEGLGQETSGFRLPDDELLDPGSAIMVIQIGTIIAGPTIFESRYVGLDLADFDPGDFGLPSTNFQAAIIGSFREVTNQVIHAVNQASPEDNDPVDIAEVAMFTASSTLVDMLNDPDNETPGQLFITTGRLADIIVENQDQGDGSEEEADQEQVLDLIFPGVGGEGDPNVAEVECNSPCEAEGDLFPHGGEGALFGFQLNIDTDEGTFGFSACTPVDVDIKPDSDNNKINVKSKKGVVPIGILSSDTFDAEDEVDQDAIAITGEVEGDDGPETVTVFAVKTSVKDLDGDGLKDVLAHFKVPELVEAGLLTVNTTELTLVAGTNAGGCVTGSDTVGHTGNNK